MAVNCLSKLRKKLPDSLLVYFLVCVFGVGSWVAVNGLWAEISILTLTLPECNCLPAVLVVIIQLANIGPFLYTLVKLCVQSRGWSMYRLEVCAVFVLVCMGFLSCLFLALFWDHTALVGGVEHSLSLMILALLLATVDCTSSVVFLPYMKHYPSTYLSGLYIGEGLSGVVPGLTALSQGLVNGTTCDTDPSELGLNFSPNVFFAVLALLMLLCGGAFTLLNTLPQARRLIAHPKNSINDSTEEQETLVPSTRRSPLATGLSLLRAHATVYLCLGLVNFLTNGALSAVSVFALFPYGSEVYHIAINLALLTTPLLSAVYVLLPHRSPVYTAVLTSLALLLGVYIFTAALLHPPPLNTYIIGKIIIVSFLWPFVAPNGCIYMCLKRPKLCF